MGRKHHPNPDIEAAIVHAEGHGWRVKLGKARSHAWGTMLCPKNDPECRCGEFCITSIWSTPKNPAAHARDLRRVVDNCTGRDTDET